MKPVYALVTVCVLLLAACQSSSVVKPASQQPELLASYYTEATRTLFAARPTTATGFALDESIVGGHYANRLEDYSPAAEAKLRDTLHDYHRLMSNHPLSDDGDKVNRDVVANIVRYYAGHPDFPIGYIDTWMGQSAFIVNQINGPAFDIPATLQNHHTIDSLDDARDYITRLDGLDNLLGGVQEKVLHDAADDWIPPKIIIDRAVAKLKRQTDFAPAEHPLIVKLKADLDALSIDAAQRADMVTSAETIVSEKVYPAYRALADTVQSLRERAPSEHGIWAQPNGTAYYAEAIRQLGDTDLDADQIHQLGLDEVKRITAEMDNLLRAEGYTQGSVGERMQQLNKEPRFLFEDSDAGRQALLDELNQHVANIDPLMDEVFASRPRYDVEIRRFPPEREVGAPGGQYTSPSIDGKTPGIYWINLHDITANPSFDLETLTYHEAIPGHHWQIALNMQQDDLPLLRRLAPSNAYVEGWALYSEQLAKELGMYDDDPFNDLGRLKAELFRAVRLVVDTGLHHKRWTREQAIDYMASTTGTAMSDVVSEIERYMIWPGQALGYKLGMLTILDVRQQAQQTLGEKFDIRAFHDEVLLPGAVPMSILKRNVNDWVSATQDKPH